MQQKDLDKVAELAAWKSEGALGLMKKDNGIQAVYGPWSYDNGIMDHFIIRHLQKYKAKRKSK
mgnify:CR=1 FL=1